MNLVDDFFEALDRLWFRPRTPHLPQDGPRMKSPHSIRNVEATTGLLRKLQESLLFTLAYDASKRRAVIVTDFPERSLGSDRTFVALSFVGVSRFQRELGMPSKLVKPGEFYQQTDHAPPEVVQAVNASIGPEGWSTDWWFGNPFGGVAIHSTRLLAHFRDARVTKSGNDWLYADAVSGEGFEFAEPFPRKLLMPDT